jgi:hypothetical protein
MVGMYFSVINTGNFFDKFISANKKLIERIKNKIIK